MNAPVKKYKQTQVGSASKERLLLMMYEGAIKFVKLAIIAGDEKKIAERCTHIGRAFDIVTELNNTLDHKIGGEIASNLEQLYIFITEQFTKANVSGDMNFLRNALKILETLHAAWVGAIEQIKRTDNGKGPTT